MNRLLTPFLILFMMGTARAESIETLNEAGVTVTFEKTGDADQVADFKKSILPEVKTILSDLSSDLGGNAKGAKLFFYSPETYHAKFPHTIDTRIPAFYDGRGVYARADNEVTQSLKEMLRHELTHLIVDHTYGPRIPSWLNEGLAVYEERKITIDAAPTFVDYNTLHIAKQDRHYIPLSQLETQGIFGRSEGTVKSSQGYRTAYVAVYELRQKFGMDEVRKYLKTTGSGGNPGREFQKVFGMPYEKFDEYLLEKAAKK